MPVPVQVTFRDMEPSVAVDAYIRNWVGKLEHIYSRIERCEVVVERPHQRHLKGQRFHVRVTLAVPGRDVVVSRDHALNGAHEDVYVAVRDAFRAARRQLEDHAHLQRDDGRGRAFPEQGRVTYLDVEGEWGYIDTDQRRLYFHSNSVLDPEPLTLGDEVRFDEEPGRDGPQATSVVRVGEHGHHRIGTS